MSVLHMTFWSSAVTWIAIFVTGPRDGIVFSLVFVGITLVAYKVFSSR